MKKNDPHQNPHRVNFHVQKKIKDEALEQSDTGYGFVSVAETPEKEKSYE